MDTDNINEKHKVPFRFWIYSILAVVVMIATVVWMAGIFSGEPNEKRAEDSLKDARMLRPM